MQKIDKLAFLARAKSKAFEKRVADSSKLITQWLESAKSPYVAFSGGKDSTVVLHLVRSLAPDTPAVHNDHEWFLPETLEFLATTPNVRRVARTRYHADFFTSYQNGKPENLDLSIEWTDTLDLRGEWARSQGYDGCAVGICSRENNYRKRHIASLGTLFFAKSYQIWQCYPVAHWSVEDVWAYIFSRKIPYNKAYDRFSELNIPLREQRIGPFANVRALPYGQLALLKQGWPSVFEEFARVYPQAKRYV